jgi:hypothetical protein
MTPALFALLVGAGIAAGLSGTMAGLASLFSYPALLAAGLPATSANVTNTVSLALSSLSSMASSRPELRGQGALLRRFGVLCVLGGAAGAGLLLLTPPGIFTRIVPFLVGGSSVVILLGDRLARLFAPSTADGHRPLVLIGVFAVAVYGGYFGAAAGVLMIALLLSALPETLVGVSALKNVLLALSNVVAAVGFAVFGPVAWATTVPLTLGLLVGNWIGPSIARRLPIPLLRWGIALAGLGLAVKLGWDAFT